MNGTTSGAAESETATLSLPDRRHRRWILAAVGIGTLMSALDGSAVNTVLPVLARELHTNVDTVEWVTSLYLLVISGLLLGVGRAGDLYGNKRTYLLGFGLFIVASALCGIAPTIELLVATRGLQGIGAAMLFANSPAILTRSFPGTHRGRALGMQATMTYLGLMAGPPLGGWLAGTVGWRAVFYLNIPVGLVAMILSMAMIPDDRPSKRPEPFDIAGASLFMLGLVLLLLALNQAHAWGWDSPATIGMLALACANLAGFIWRERRTTSPMLDLSLFRSRIFTASATSAVLNYIAIYSVLFVLPFLLIRGRGMTTSHAGLLMSAQPFVMAIVAPISGALSDRIGSRFLGTLGMILLGSGLVILAIIAGSGTPMAMAGALGVIGLGVGLFVSPNNSALMGAAPRHRQGIAAGVLATARNVGMALGIGLAGAVFTTISGSIAASPRSVVAGVRGSLVAAAVVAFVGSVAAWVKE